MPTRILVIPGGPGLGARYLDPLRTLLSPNPVTFRETSGARMDDHVQQVESARRESGAAVILGHSFGGLVACHHALAFPETAGSLVLLDPDPAMFEEWEAFRDITSRRRRSSDAEAMEAVAGTPGWQRDPVLVAHYFRAALAPYFFDPDQAAQLDFGFSPDSMARIQSQTTALRADLGPWDLSGNVISSRALLIHGADSVFAASSPETLSRLFPNGDSHILPSVGHFPHLEAPDTVRALVTRFLGEPDLSP